MLIVTTVEILKIEKITICQNNKLMLIPLRFVEFELIFNLEIRRKSSSNKGF